MNSIKTKYSGLIIPAYFAVGVMTVNAATLMNMTFNNGGVDIDESGWNGTTATGGSLAANLTVTTGMHVEGDFTSQGQVDVFHVDGWKTTNSTNTGVGFTIGAASGYTMSIGGGSETFSTKLHQHPQNASDMFNAVILTINGIEIGTQTYTPAGNAQTLVWNIGANTNLDNITTAVFKLRFTGITNTANNNHGPEWSLADGAFMNFTGSVQPIPEPSQSMLVVFGLGLAVLSRRRK